jgi:hypothetical protein
MVCLMHTRRLNSMNEIAVEKLKMHSPNFVDKNIAKIAELFPNAQPKVVMKKANYNAPLILIY